jgi:hypothetical protein
MLCRDIYREFAGVARNVLPSVHLAVLGKGKGIGDVGQRHLFHLIASLS